MSEPFWRLFAALAVAMVVTLGLAWCVGGCSSAGEKRAEMAIRTAAYANALNTCYEATKSYATYETCAQKADADFGRVR